MPRSWWGRNSSRALSEGSERSPALRWFGRTPNHHRSTGWSGLWGPIGAEAEAAKAPVTNDTSPPVSRAPHTKGELRISEYQYYEFQAVDRPLTQKEISELRHYSSRAEITSSSFVNVYEWGNFRGDPDSWMEQFFDGFLYLANWGTRWTMLRVPGSLLDAQSVRAYCVGEGLTCRRKGDHVILSFSSEAEGYEWVGGEGWLGALLPIRTDLMQGDLRALYLGWLLAVQREEVDDDEQEPPVPPGLGDLSASLVRLTEFLGIDSDLIAAATEHSKVKQPAALSEKEIGIWISMLLVEEKDSLLARLMASDNRRIALEIRQRAIREVRREVYESPARRRAAGELAARARSLGEQRRNKEAEKRACDEARRERERAAMRKEHLESLGGTEDAVWAQIHRLIATRQPKRYDEAVSRLRDLRDLAQIQGDTGEFSARMSRLHHEHQRKASLVDRFLKARLLG